MAAQVIVEARCDKPWDQFQGTLALVRLQGVQIEGIGPSAVGLDVDAGHQLPGERFLPDRWRPVEARLRRRASECCSLTSICSPVRRDKRWHSATMAHTVGTAE